MNDVPSIRSVAKAFRENPAAVTDGEVDRLFHEHTALKPAARAEALRRDAYEQRSLRLRRNMGEGV